MSDEISPQIMITHQTPESSQFPTSLPTSQLVTQPSQPIQPPQPPQPPQLVTQTTISQTVLQPSLDIVSQVVEQKAQVKAKKQPEKDKTQKKKKRKNEDTKISLDTQCSICQECMLLPVTMVCGHNYCKSCIEQWIQTESKPKCPLCKCPLGSPAMVLKKLGVNQVLDDLIKQQMSNDTEYSKRLKKMEKSVKQKQFSKKYLKSSRFSSLEERMIVILEESRGTIKYNDLLNALVNPNDNSPRFEKAELDFFLHEESIKGTRFLLIGEFVVDWFYNGDLGQGGFLLKYLKEHMTELVYVLLNGGLEDDVLKEFNVPQSEFFKKLKLDDENRIERNLFKIKHKV